MSCVAKEIHFHHGTEFLKYGSQITGICHLGWRRCHALKCRFLGLVSSLCIRCSGLNLQLTNKAMLMHTEGRLIGTSKRMITLFMFFLGKDYQRGLDYLERVETHQVAKG